MMVKKLDDRCSQYQQSMKHYNSGLGSQIYNPNSQPIPSMSQRQPISRRTRFTHHPLESFKTPQLARIKNQVFKPLILTASERHVHNCTPKLVLPD